MPLDNPSQVPIVGPATPYLTPEMLVDAPTGIAWSTLPRPNSTPAMQLAAQTDLCARATSMIDGYCNQPLRATVDTEYLTGPGDFRLQLQPTGVARLMMSRGPVLSIVSGQISSAAAFPRSWQTIPGNQFEPEIPLLGVYGTTAPGDAGAGGQSILLAPGWVSWLFGRQSSRLQVTYINGWPHGSLTAGAAAAATSIAVDDITGWEGAGGVIYDTGGTQEYVTVTAVTPNTTGAISGPGTLTLGSGLAFDHQAGTLISTLPMAVIQAGIYVCVALALTRGATSTTVQSVSGGTSGGGTQPQKDYTDMAYKLVHPYRRVI